jgi:hypothetical protein
MIPEPCLLMNENDSANDSVNNEASLLLSSPHNSDKSNNNIVHLFRDIAVSVGISPATRAGMELGLWKFLGTTADLFGLSQTLAGHGAFHIEFTSFLVTATQRFMVVAIPTGVWSDIALALESVAPICSSSEFPQTRELPNPLCTDKLNTPYSYQRNTLLGGGACTLKYGISQQ